MKINEIKKSDKLIVFENTPTKYLRVKKCINLKQTKEGMEPLYLVEIFQEKYLTREQINNLTCKENCLANFLS